jgi:hypothetical protein
VFDLKKHKAIALIATRGPWQWFGNTKMHEVYLSTIDRGRVFVMDFARWGMRGAQPRFQVNLDDSADRSTDKHGGGIMTTVSELAAKDHALGPKFQVSYRRDFSGIGHPDAEHIAANSPDVTLKLIARIERLEEAARSANTPGGCSLDDLIAVVDEGIP